MNAGKLLKELLRAPGAPKRSVSALPEGLAEAHTSFVWSDFVLYHVSVSIRPDTAIFDYFGEADDAEEVLPLSGADRLLDDLLRAAEITESVRSAQDPQHEFAVARVEYEGATYWVDVRITPDERVPRSEKT